MRLLNLTSTFLSQIWQFMRLPFPGTDVPIGAMLFLPVVVSVVIAFFRSMFGIGGFAQLVNTAQSFSRYKRSKDTKKG